MIACRAEAVIEPHRPFAYRRAVSLRGAGELDTQARRIREEEIQILAFHGGSGAVKHRVYVVRAAFERARIQAAPPQSG